MKLDVKVIWQDFLDRVVKLAVFLLLAYLVALFLSIIFVSWKKINWPAFHWIIVVVVFLLLVNLKVRSFWRSIFFQLKNNTVEQPTLLNPVLNKIITKYSWARWLVAGFLVFSQNILRNRSQLVWNKKTITKLVSIAVILLFSLFKSIGVVDFLVLVYGLVSVFFILESRIAAGVALFFLVWCPILLIFKKEAVAEQMAIFAYYFLVITAATQLREHRKLDN